MRRGCSRGRTGRVGGWGPKGARGRSATKKGGPRRRRGGAGGAAVATLHKKKLAAAPADEREALHMQLADEHERIAGGVDSAIEIGVVDEKIDPAHTPRKLTQALAEAPQRRGRHKNIPL